MLLKENIQRAGVGFLLDRVLKYVDKDPKKNILKLIGLAEKFAGKTFPEKTFKGFRDAISDDDNVWNTYAMNLLKDIDRGYLKKMFLSFVLGAGLHGTRAVRANREKYKCNIPWLMLIDPTSACNMNCKGCWAAEYGHKLNLTYDEINNVINQGVELGTHLYMFTGGEPLIRKKDILTLARENNDCIFLAFTNGTLVDDAFCEDMKKCGNFALALSIEGDEAVNDSRRGEGVYQKTLAAMKLLKKHKCLFGTSICYTSKNYASVTSDEFYDFMIENGAKYAWYFHYMPVGNDASVDLLPAPEQRIYMRSRVREIRNMTTGKGLFTMDFQNDGEFVGGCIAGGRNYFHINANGDAEPCVFIHYSGANIRKNTLLEILKQPLFMAYYNNQPFNENHLRPCPMLENPEILQRIVKESGAKSTDLQSPESAEHLCEKCEAYAKNWKPCADKLWAETKMPQHSYENYKK